MSSIASAILALGGSTPTPPPPSPGPPSSPPPPTRTPPPPPDLPEYIRPSSVRAFVHKRNAQRHSPSRHGGGPEEITKIPAENRFTAKQCRSPVGYGWDTHTHPEGQLYFRARVDPTSLEGLDPSAHREFYTNVYLYDAVNLWFIQEASIIINIRLQGQQNLPPNINIGLELDRLNDGRSIVYYYICDMDMKEVLWLTECSVDFLVEDENFPVYKKEHLQHAQSLSYWYHIYMFPHDREYTQAQLDELRMIGGYHLYDKKVLRFSSALHNTESLHRFREISGEIKLDPQSRYVSKYDMVKIARIQLMLSAERLRQHHGTKWVKHGWNETANRDARGVGDAKNPTWLFTLSSWLFFFYPSLYLRRLRQLWVDFEFQDHIWEDFITDVQEDWAASITPSTVILATNVGFLAIPSVDSPGGSGGSTSERSAGQIISYISTLLCIGNVIACAILTWQHRGMSHLSSDYVAPYCHIQYAAKPWKMEILAMVLSIPIVFFIWGMITFCAAILWVAFHNTTTRTRAQVGTIGLVTVALLVFLMIYDRTRWTETDVPLRTLQEVIRPGRRRGSTIASGLLRIRRRPRSDAEHSARGATRQNFTGHDAA